MREATRSVEDRELRKSRLPQLGSATPVSVRPRVLLVEDDADLRRLLAFMLRKDGYEIIEVSDGVEALDFVGLALMKRPSSQPVDLIISDICMPGWSGLQVLSAIHATGWSIPVVLITAFGDRRTYAEAARLGAAALFDKPFDLGRFRKTLAEILPPSTAEEALDFATSAA